MALEVDNELLCCAEGAVAKLQLNRPARGNALSIALMQALSDALRTAQSDPQVQLIVLSAAGRHFCAGADLGWAQPGSALWSQGNAALCELLDVLYATHKPVLAQVQGTVIGGGVALLSLCDEVIAADGANWRLPEVQLGMVPSAIAPALQQVASPAAVRKLLMGNGTWSSAQMQAMGVVSEVVPAEQLVGAAEAAQQRWLALPPHSLQATKQWLRELGQESFQHASERGRGYAASLEIGEGK